MEYFITALIPIIAIIVVILISKRIASHKFKCKHCFKEFTIKWTTVLITMHDKNEYLIKCPYCYIKDWCIKRQKNK